MRRLLERTRCLSRLTRATLRCLTFDVAFDCDGDCCVCGSGVSAVGYWIVALLVMLLFRCSSCCSMTTPLVYPFNFLFFRYKTFGYDIFSRNLSKTSSFGGF